MSASLIILFLILPAILLIALTKKSECFRSAAKLIRHGFREGLKGSGVLPFRARYPAELYVWETMDDEEVCEECLARARLQPRDIADWMAIGLPGTPESETACGEDCRCRLVKIVKKHQDQRIRGLQD